MRLPFQLHLIDAKLCQIMHIDVHFNAQQCGNIVYREANCRKQSTHVIVTFCGCFHQGVCLNLKTTKAVIFCRQVAFAAMDCTRFQTTCSSHEVQGYPTFKYFNYGKNDQKYTGGREVRMLHVHVYAQWTILYINELHTCT